MKRKKFGRLALAVAICTILSTISAPAIPVSAVEEGSKLAAFPGAEGGGMWTTGARGAKEMEIYHVTKLTDDGSRGTLRDAVSESNRIIVFDVAGNIELVNALSIIGDNLTILGQTAPGDGICIKDNTVGIYGDNVILRYLRFRMGDAKSVEDDTLGGRGINNVIIDHCTMSWSVDECASFYENTNFTMQWCIISESLKNSVHAKDSHGYGGIWGGVNASFHHNLLAHHDSRNPRIDMGDLDASDYTKQLDLTDLRNNVIYNWGGNSAYGGQNGAPVNIVNCYYKYGPATNSNVRSRIFQLSSSGNGIYYDWSTDLYVSGNYVDGSSTVTNDNAKGVDKDENTKNYNIWTDSNLTEDAKTVHFRYADDYPVETETAQEAYESVLADAGASIVRDEVDTRIIKEVRGRTSTYGNKGLIDSPSDVGGYPELTGVKAKDSDNDGIPNEWEDLNGLDKFDKTDALDTAASGYLYIEEYANALADGSYVRNTDYDPNVPDYDPSTDPDVTPDPDATPEPSTELISSWTADSGDLNQPAGTELMPGLYNVISFDRSLSNEVTFPDGSVYDYAVTRKDGENINGGWNAESGTAVGTALKYTAPENGVFTLYAYSVSNTKTFYVVPEGAADPTTENIYVQECVGSSVPIQCQVELEAGKTYYFYLDGSKARFCAAKFEKYVSGLETVSSWTANSGNLNQPAGTELMPGLSNVISFDRSLSNEVTFPDGSVYDYAVTRKDGENINGGWNAESGTAVGTALKYTAPENGVFTLYAYSVSNTKTFYVVPEGAADPTTENIYVQECVGSSVPIQCQVELEAGKTYYFYLDGSKARFCAAKFERYTAPQEPYTISGLSATDTETTFTVTKNMDAADDDAIIIAYYGENGTLTDVRTRTISHETATGSEVVYVIDRGAADNETVKVFIWDSEDNIKPLIVPAT